MCWCASSLDRRAAARQTATGHALRAWILGLVLWLSPVAAAAQQAGGAAAEQPGPVLQRNVQERLLQMLLPVQVDVPRPDGLVLDQVRIDRDRVHMAAHRVAQPTSAPVLALLLVPKAQAQPTEPTSASFAIRTQTVPTTPEATALHATLLASLQRNDRGDLYVQPILHEQHLDRPSRTRDFQQVLWALAGVLAVIALSALVLHRLGRLAPQGQRLVRHVQITHLLPASLQCVIFLYWSLYWRELPEVAAVIALQVVVALLVDGLLGLWRSGMWTLSFGALPVALSSHLFVVFEPGGAWLSTLGIAAGLASKHWLRGPDGHLFNPSAIGMFSVGLLTLFFPQIGYGDTAYEFALAPNTTELILLLALVVQLRLPVVLVSIATFVGLFWAGSWFGRLTFDPAWPPIALVATLLVTDPATQPRTPLGRIAFGLTAGVLMRLCAEWMGDWLGTDTWAKVGGVALANLLVPAINAGVARLPEPWRDGWGLLAKRFNPVHIALWWMLMVGNLTGPQGKSALLQYSKGVQERHVWNGTPFVRPLPDGSGVRCADNPMLCRAFSFELELKCWLGDASQPLCLPGRDGWQGPGRGGPANGVQPSFQAMVPER